MPKTGGRKPSIFIGSSSEGLSFARAIKEKLGEEAEVTIWNEGLFEVGSVTLDELRTFSYRFDFAVLVLTPDDQNQPPGQQITYFGWKQSVSRETLFFVIVALAGLLGGLIHVIRSLSWYVGNRDFRWSWVPFNLLLPVVGALCGTVFYLVLRAGLFSPSTSVDQASPFGFAAVAVLVGLFSEQALEKLRQVASNLFAERPEGEDHVPASGDTRGSGGET